MASSDKDSSKNRLLAALPRSEYRRLLPKLETVSLSLKQRIYESLERIDHVYFPLNGVASILAYMKDGTGIEVATVGNEGMVGLPVFLGADNLYTQTLVVQIAQGNACNGAHSITHRCARWLLTTHDRVGRRQQFGITQEFLGRMLGVRRAGVSEVASALKKSKLIDYNRGVIHILNRKGLEERTCECYWVIKNEIDRSNR
jgi:CRP-like cAMP-binding protein